MPDVSQLQVSIGVDSSALDRGLADANSKVTGFGSAFGGIAAAAGTAFVAAGAAVAAGIGVGVKAAGDLQQAVANISTIKPSIDTSEVFAALNDMSTRIPQSADQLGDALYNIFSSVNVSSAEGLQLLETFATGAIGASTDAQTFGTAAMGVMNAYGMSVTEAGHVSDVFFNTIAAGVVTGPELARGLGMVTSSAKLAGVNLDELGALIVGVTQAGGEASTNINNLNNVLTKIQTPAAATGFEKLGISIVNADGSMRSVIDVLTDLKAKTDDMTEAAKLAAIQEIFPDMQARAGATTIMDQLGKVNDALAVNQTATGSTAEAYAKMAATFNSQTKLLGNTLTSILTTVGAEILPAITPMITAFAQSLPGAFKTAQGAWEGLKTALGGETGGLADIGAKLGISPAVTKAIEDGLVKVGDSIRTLKQVMAGEWAASDKIDPFVNAVGKIGLKIKDDVIPAITDLITKVGELAGIDTSGVSSPWEKVAQIASESVAKVIEANDRLTAETERSAQVVGKSTEELNAFWLDAQGVTDTSSGGITGALDRMATGFAAAMSRIKNEGTQGYNETWMGGQGIQVTTDQGAASVLTTLDGWVITFTAAMNRIKTEGTQPYVEMWADAQGATGTGVQTILDTIGEWSHQFALSVAGINTVAGGTYDQFWMDAQGTSETGSSAILSSVTTWLADMQTGFTTWVTESAASVTTFWSDVQSASTEGSSAILTAVSKWLASQASAMAEGWAGMVKGATEGWESIKTSVAAGVTAALKSVTDTATQWTEAGRILGANVVAGVTAGLAGLVESVVGPVRRALDAARSAAAGFTGGGAGSRGGGGATGGMERISLLGTGLLNKEPGSGGRGSPTASREEVDAYIRAAAIRAGHDPETAVRVSHTEGGAGSVGDSGRSFGPYQLFTGGGLGNKFKDQTGIDPSDPSTWPAQIDWVMRNLGQTGWGPWNGARAAGITGMQGINTAPPRPGAGGAGGVDQFGFAEITAQAGAASAAVTNAFCEVIPQASDCVTDTAASVTASTAAMATAVTGSTSMMAADATTIVTDLGNAISTITQNTSGTTIATFTDLAGNVTNQSVTMANGVTTTLAAMSAAGQVSTQAMGDRIVTTMTDMAGNVTTTTTTLAGAVIDQAVVMAAGVTTSTATMGAGVTSEMGTMVETAIANGTTMSTEVVSATGLMAEQAIANNTVMGAGVGAANTAMWADVTAQATTGEAGFVSGMGTMVDQAITSGGVMGAGVGAANTAMWADVTRQSTIGSGEFVSITGQMVDQVHTSITDLSDGTVMTITRMGTDATAIITDASGNIVQVIDLMSQDGQLSVTELQTVTSEQFKTMAEHGGESSEELAGKLVVLGEGFVDVAKEAAKTVGPIDDFQEALNNIEPPDLSDVIEQLEEVEDAAKDAAKAISKVGNTKGNRDKWWEDERAAGGPVAAGTTYLVGERGPELFRSSASGDIVPNHLLGGRGGDTIIVNVNLLGPNLSASREIEDAVVTAIERAGARGRV